MGIHLSPVDSHQKGPVIGDYTWMAGLNIKIPKSSFQRTVFNSELNSYMDSRTQIPIYSTYPPHYTDIIMGAIASQIASLTIVYSVYSETDQRKHHSSASLAFVWGIHREPVNSPHKWPITRKMFPFDDVIMKPHKFVWYLVGNAAFENDN